ncbi:polysaccharide deacetylase family protein [Prosthecomicrobium sp. N25]|uniref:polysaccharide deacetylase family protein n=1 Tax=Prosthecomicrobium sp. N25 TaxID=3129254 RepID=UPI0030789847
MRPTHTGLSRAGALFRGAPTALAVLAFAAALSAGPSASAATCREDALGTARTLPVDTAGGLFVGTKSYPGTLPLGPKEVVLTFDDGPAGRTTDAVLAALEAECVKATFFVVGRQAASHPDQLRRIEAAGHTVAHHSMTHPVMTTLGFEAGRADIESGWQTVDRILLGRSGARPATPFFRFPGFAPTPALSDWLKGMDVGVFGADLWGSDWNPTTSSALLAQVLGRLDKRGGGILLLHDTHAHTAGMVAPLLRALKERGYKVVHIVPAPHKAG